MLDDFAARLQSSLGAAYSVERELGGGGMSRVFVAEEIALRRTVVVKVLPAETAGQVSIERFKREIMLAARLQHPHIVPLLSAGDASGLPYFTMPFVEGESLRVRLARHGELPVAEAMRVLREIAAALAYAHDRGIVHRDIKPDNVLLSGGSAIVTDFGVAKALSASSNAEHAGVTSLGVALGTPAYMAPEQASADPAIDHRADIYAFGVLAYELLTGQPPFTGRTPANLLAAHVNEAPEAITKRRASLPVALSALVMRCLEKRPADRPQNASEVVHSLDDIATPSGGMQPTSAVPAAMRAGAAARASVLRAAAVAFAAILVILAAIGWMTLRGGRASRGEVAQLKTIAVLPFSNGGDTASDYFAEGITDELHGQLASLPGVTVKARSVARFFKDQADDQAAVAARLGIGSLVVGSVRRAGSQVRITTEILRVSDNSTLWSETFDSDESGLFALQDSIARAIATALQERFADTRGPPAGPAGTSNAAAYDLFLRGKFLMRSDPERSLGRAIALFQQAIDTDPSFARAHAALGDALATLAYVSDTSIDSVFVPALAAIDKAITLDPLLAEAHAIRGIVLIDDWPPRWGDAERSLRRAIEIDPRRSLARGYFATYLWTVGRIDESIAEYQRAMDLDPFSPGAGFGLSGAQLASHQFAASLATARRVVALDPGYSPILDHLAIVLVLQGKPDSALLVLASRPDSNAYGTQLAAHAFVYARAGQRGRAESIARELERRGRSSPRHLGSLGYALLGLGDSTRALESFLRAADARVRPTRGLSELASPEYDPIRSLPRYSELMRKLNLQDQPVAKLKAGGGQ